MLLHNPKTFLPDHPKRGLTLIPALACLAMIALLMTAMAKKQVQYQNSIKSLARKTLARQIAASEAARLHFLIRSGQKIQPEKKLLSTQKIKNLRDDISIEISNTNRPGKSWLIRVKIPANASQVYTIEEIEIP